MQLQLFHRDASSYQRAGQMSHFKDWKKLINPDHIDKATKYIRRLSLALHLAFVCTYMQSLSLQEVEAFKDDLRTNKIVGSKWEERFMLHRRWHHLGKRMTMMT
jgi:hypothetical protein